MNTFVGKLKLIYSESIILSEYQPIDIILSDAIEGDYKISIVFETKEGVSAQANAASINSHHLMVKLQNFRHGHEGSCEKPIPIGTLENKPLFLAYYLKQYAGDSRFVVVNFLQGVEIAADSLTISSEEKVEVSDGL